DHDLRIARLAADAGEGGRYRVRSREIELDDHAVAALVLDCRRKARGIIGTAGRHDDKVPFAGELLGNGAAHTPPRADRQVAVVGRFAVGQFGVAATPLPFGGGADPPAARFPFFFLPRHFFPPFARFSVNQTASRAAASSGRRCRAPTPGWWRS